MAFMGLEGMARRMYTYPNVGHLAMLNGIASAGTVLMAVGAALFFVNVAIAVYRRVPVPANPWGGYSLEWLTSSPPPEFNFHELPPIRSRVPAWDAAASAEAART
jgi:heme/copper-type cytochrome/quinol oxidase subunit 1